MSGASDRKTREVIALTTKHKVMLESAMAFQPSPLILEHFRANLRPLGRFDTTKLTENGARECFVELQRLLVTKALHRDKLFAPSSLLEDAWQMFIIFTEDYAQFCDLLDGFIHHRPLGYEDRKIAISTRKVQELVKDLFPNSNPYYWGTDGDRVDEWKRQFGCRSFA